MGKYRNSGSKFRFGFTLSEVLITLVIIGVIAALTIPTAIAKYQKQETASRLKKVYSTLAQTTRRAVVDHGNVENWNLGTAWSANAALTFFNTYMAPYLSLSSEPKKTGWNRDYFYLNGTEQQYESKYIRAYLSDGSSITISIEGNAETNKKTDMYIDINGDKKPNMLGRDIFVFYYAINSNGRVGEFIPAGLLNSRNQLLSTPGNSRANCNKNESGLRCASVIMEDGWQIKDDYPW